MTSRSGLTIAWAALSALMFAGAPAAAQTLAIARGADSVVVSQAEIAALPHIPVKVTQHGQAHAFEGVRLRDLLGRVGYDFGKPLHGRDLAAAVVATGSDGYRAALAVAELDPATRAGEVIVADREDGHPLPPGDGPYRLVLTDDLRPARAVRNVVRIELVDLGALTVGASGTRP
jgi:hypothetical protein